VVTDIRKQEEVLQESYMMVPDSKSRLEASIADLQGILVSRLMCPYRLNNTIVVDSHNFLDFTLSFKSIFQSECEGDGSVEAATITEARAIIEESIAAADI
jgi:hypothetical protein